MSKEIQVVQPKAAIDAFTLKDGGAIIIRQTGHFEPNEIQEIVVHSEDVPNVIAALKALSRGAKQ